MRSSWYTTARRIGRAPPPRALRRSIGATNPHLIASRSGDQQRVLRCGLHGRQLQARRQAGGVGIGPREGVVHQRVGGRRRAGRRRRQRGRRRRAGRRRRQRGRRRRRERVDLHLREVESPPSSRQLDHHVLCQLRALAVEQWAIRRRSRLGADSPRVCGADAIGDCVVPQSRRVSLAVVHSDVGDFGRRAEI
eukprot:scaffold17844_cov63-Phaeocystis_antarctica.AAC.2